MNNIIETKIKCTAFLSRISESHLLELITETIELNRIFYIKWVLFKIQNFFQAFHSEHLYLTTYIFILFAY